MKEIFFLYSLSVYGFFGFLNKLEKFVDKYDLGYGINIDKSRKN